MPLTLQRYTLVADLTFEGLDGYRLTSLDRATDTDQLIVLMRACIAQGKREAYTDAMVIADVYANSVAGKSDNPAMAAAFATVMSETGMKIRNQIKEKRDAREH